LTEKKAKNSLVKISEKNLSKVRYFHTHSKYAKIFQKTHKLREEMHFEIYKMNPLPALYKKQRDRHSLKSESPYEKTNCPAPLASLASLTDKYTNLFFKVLLLAFTSFCQFLPIPTPF